MLVVYLSPVPWRSIAQRPHFFSDYCLKNGVEKFIWVEPIASRFPRLSDFKSKVVGVESGSFDKPERLKIMKLNILIPIEPWHRLYEFINKSSLKQFENDLSEKISVFDNVKLICGKPSILSLRLIRKFNFDSVVFDIMDDYPHFFSGVASRSIDTLLKSALVKADEVWFSSTALFDKYKYKVKKAILVKNACDKKFSLKVKELKCNQDNEKLSDYIVYGYIGSIAKWFDWEFVIKLAENRPNTLIKLIGPTYVVVPLLPDNIIIEPAIEHKDVPAALRGFDFGIIPFKVNKLTQAVDPVKYYEYVAAELPIITTEFGEMKERVISLHAVTLDSHLNGLEPNLESVIFWEDRFRNLL